MNDSYIFEHVNFLERILSYAYQKHYSLGMVEKSIAYSPYFQLVEKENKSHSPITTENDLLEGIFNDPSLDEDNYTPQYNECLWAAEAYIRIQKETGLTFEAIFLYIPIKEMYKYFPLYHEMDFSQIVNEFKRLYLQKSVLSIVLSKYRYSLKYVSEITNIPYNTLTSYKQRKRDIKKISAEMAYTLADFLHIRIETLLELKF